MNTDNFLGKFARCFLALLFLQKTAFAQIRPVDPPRLAVGIVVDQMRYDFLLKYYDKFGEGGFKRLLEGGFNCENTNYDYAPTYTGPGHASIYAGTTPAVHGIIGNDWYSREEMHPVYCASDPDARNVGGTEEAGKMSPRRLRTANVADELRLFSNKKSKVVGVAIKDRGAILPAGHCPNAAFWFDQKTAGWMSCNWYMDSLPGWVRDFNKKELPEKLIAGGWSPLAETLRPGRSIADDNRYEDPYKGEKSPVFPHDLPKIAQKEGQGIALAASPFGNELTEEFAKSAIINEKLGADEWPDLLALSFSSTDLVGHSFGPSSLEVEDTYLRLDRVLADFFQFLDKKVGAKKWAVFLTADHGVAYNSNLLRDDSLTMAGFWGRAKLADTLNRILEPEFGKKMVLSALNGNIVFDREKIAAAKLDFSKIEAATVGFLENLEGVYAVMTAKQLTENEYTQMPKSLVQRGFLPHESGDLVVIFAPGMLEWSQRGSSHGSPWSYDTRVPCLWYGWKIPRGTFSGPLEITDIAPTLSVILNIPFPGGCTGQPIEPLLSKIK